MPQPKPLKTFIDKDQLSEDLSFSVNSLTDAFMRQAALYAHYAQNTGEAIHQEDRCKQSRDIIWARLDKAIRKEAVRDGEKLTEAQIAQRIRMNASYQRAQARRNEAKMIADLCKSACEAFRQRRDMLIQSGADAREEMKGELRMREVESKRETREDRMKRLKEEALKRGKKE